MSQQQEYTVKISTIAQLMGYLIGVLWISSETVRDVAYMKDQLTESVAPALVSAKEEREELTYHITKLEYEYQADKKAIWVEIEHLKKDVERIQRQLERRLP